MHKILLGNYLFGFVKLTKNDDCDKYKYYGYGIGTGHKHGTFSILNSTGFAKNVIVWVEMLCSSVDIDNKKYILIFSKGPTNGWDDITFTAEKECYKFHWETE